MRFADYFALAFRSLRRSRLRSALTISAIVVGATGLTIMLTFVTTLKSYIVNQFVQTGQINQVLVAQTPNLTYQPSGNSGEGGGQNQGTTSVMTATLEAKINALPHVTGVAATLQGGGGALQYFTFGPHRLAVNGTDGFETNGVIRPSLLAGRDLGPQDTGAVVLLTQDYADALGFKGDYARLVGQRILLHTMAGYTGIGATLPTTLPPQNQCGNGQHNVNCGPASGLPAIDLPAVVVGVVNSSFATQTIFVPLSWDIAVSNQAQPQDVQYPQQSHSGCSSSGPCQPGSNGSSTATPGPPQGPGTVRGGWATQTTAQFVANQGGFQSFLVKVDNTNNVPSVASSINRFGVSTATGIDQLNNQKSKANIVGLVLGGLGLIALGIAALGVMNTMVMSVLERTREIGVMRALGARRSTIRRLFTFEAAGLGFFGGLFGVIIGFVFVLIAKPIISNAVKSGSTLTGTNFSVPLWLAILVIAGTSFIGFISGLLPARRAARLDPVEALRYE